MRYPWLGKSADYDWKLVDRMLREGSPVHEIATATGLTKHHVQVYGQRFCLGLKMARIPKSDDRVSITVKLNGEQLAGVAKYRTSHHLKSLRHAVQDIVKRGLGGVSP